MKKFKREKCGFMEKILDRYFALKGVKMIRYEAVLCCLKTKIKKTKYSYILLAKKPKYQDEFFTIIKEIYFDEGFEQALFIYHNQEMWRDIINERLEE